jgi:uncharacterized protein (TIGR02594 family)
VVGSTPMTDDVQPGTKSFFRRTIDNKPWPAILAAAFLASVGAQAAQTVAPALGTYVRSLYPSNAEIVIFIKHKANSAPVADAMVTFIDPQTQQTISDAFKTNTIGMAVKVMRVRPGTYAIKITYMLKDVEYQLINPFEIAGNKQASFEFSEESWLPRTAGLTPARTIDSTTLAIAQGNTPNWLSIAYKEIGQKEIPGPQNNPRILEYWRSITNDSSITEDMPWTSAFIEWSLNQVGIKGPKSGLARSWASWGRPLSEPAIGCIVVFWRDSPTGMLGHVGFYVGEDADNVIVVGGNQNNSVSLAKFPKSRVLAYRMPN